MKEKTFTLPGHSRLTQEIVSELDSLLSFSPPKAIRQSLLKVYLQYIISEHESLPNDFEGIACDFYLLIEFFAAAEEGIP